jgi:c(7)-type cytochrome triheme protein
MLPSSSVRTLMVILALGVAGAVMAHDLPKLPADLTLPQSSGSPGKVVFSHLTHVGMQGKPNCTSCHPRPFSILGTSPVNSDRAITHAKMEKGRQCGACHNGKAASGFDDCTNCHRQ